MALLANTTNIVNPSQGHGQQHQQQQQQYQYQPLTKDPFLSHLNVRLTVAERLFLQSDFYASAELCTDILHELITLTSSFTVNFNTNLLNSKDDQHLLPNPSMLSPSSSASVMTTGPLCTPLPHTCAHDCVCEAAFCLLIQCAYECVEWNKIQEHVQNYYGSVGYLSYPIFLLITQCRLAALQYSQIEVDIEDYIRAHSVPMSVFPFGLTAPPATAVFTSQFTELNYEQLMELLLFHVFVPSKQYKRALQYIRQGIKLPFNRAKKREWECILISLQRRFEEELQNAGLTKMKFQTPNEGSFSNGANEKSSEQLLSTPSNFATGISSTPASGASSVSNPSMAGTSSSTLVSTSVSSLSSSPNILVSIRNSVRSWFVSIRKLLKFILLHPSSNRWLLLSLGAAISYYYKSQISNLLQLMVPSVFHPGLLSQWKARYYQFQQILLKFVQYHLSSLLQMSFSTGFMR